MSVGQQFPMSVWGPLRESLYVWMAILLGVGLPKNFADRDLIETSITFASRSAFFVVCSRAANAAFTPIHAVYQTWKRIEREKCCIEDAGTVFTCTHIRSRIAFFSIVRNIGNSAAGRVDITSAASRPHAPNASIANGDEKRLELLF